jgi:hypothetical protein
MATSALADFFKRLMLAVRYVRNGQRHLFWDVLSGRRGGAQPRARYGGAPMVVVQAPMSRPGRAQGRHERVEYSVRTLRVRLRVLELALDSQLATCFSEAAPPETEELLETGTG